MALVSQTLARLLGFHSKRVAFSNNLLRNKQCFEPIKSVFTPTHSIQYAAIRSFSQQKALNTDRFKQLEPRRTKFDVKLLSQFDFFNTLNQRTFFFRKRDKPDKKRVPKLILIQNPFTWLMIKIDFGVLRTVWDPHFAEREFKFGTRQAISKVTQVISKGEFDQLNGLLTKAARQSLMRELDRNWGEKQRSLLALQRDDIQICSPRKVYFIRIADKKFCDVDMAFLALKWAPINSLDSLIFTEIFARFHREYTPHSIPEWTIAYFKVTRFEVLRRK